MQRPQQVQDAIELRDDGLHLGHYCDYRLFAAYQPIFALSGDGSASIAAYEGLVRPFLGDAPVDAKAFFESIDPDDLLFVECMCQALHIRNYALVTPVDRVLFVNINPAVYDSIGMLEREFAFLLKQFPKYGLDNDTVVFELLETAPYSAVILKWLRQMARENHVRFALDDFGRQHSNIDRYVSLEPDVVKIDRILLGGEGLPAASHDSLRSTISRFHDDGAQVVIEGIESAEQLNIAAGLGADFVQGYYLARPQMLPYEFAAADEAGSTAVPA